MVVVTVKSQTSPEGETKNPAEGLNYPISVGVLSTGIKYEFHGEFNFLEFRLEHGFYWELTTHVNINAPTHSEVAEEGQFYLLPALRTISQRREHVEGESGIIVIRYCPETNNWVVQYVLPEVAQSMMLGEPNILSVNRITGALIEYSRNMGSVSIVEGQDRWQRTLGDPSSRLRRLFDRLF